MIAVFRDSAVVDDVTAYGRALEQGVEASDGELAIVVIVREDVSPPPAAVRGALSEVMSFLKHNAAGIGCIIEGGGVVQAAKRTVSSVMFALAGVRVPTKIFSRVDECAAWLGSRIEDASGSQPRLEAMIRDAMSRASD